MAIDLEQFRIASDTRESQIDLNRFRRSTTPPKKKSLLSRAGKFVAETFTPLAVSAGRALALRESIGEVADSALFKKVMERVKNPALSKQRKKYWIRRLQEVQPNIVNQVPELKEVFEKTGRQIAGEALVTGLSVLPTPIGKTLKAKVGIGAGVGAGFGLGGALEEDKKGKELIKPTAIGAGVGAAIPFVGAGIKKTFKALTRSLPKRLVQSALKQTPKEKLAGKDVSEFVLRKRKVGTANKLIKDSNSEINRLGKEVQSLLSKKKAKSISRNELLTGIVDKINSEGGDTTQQEVFIIINKLSPQARGLLKQKKFSPQTANKLRMSIDKTLGDRGFLVSQVPHNKGILRSFANALRNKVKDTVETTRPLFDTMSKEIRLRDTLARNVARKTGGQLLSFGDLIGGGLGLGGGLPGVVSGVVGRRVLQSTPFLTGTGTVLSQLGKLGTKIAPILQRLEPAEQKLILRALTKGRGK